MHNQCQICPYQTEFLLKYLKQRHHRRQAKHVQYYASVNWKNESRSQTYRKYYEVININRLWIKKPGIFNNKNKAYYFRKFKFKTHK